MIIAKCPLRVSLVGGSTDLQQFIDRYGYGKVISFPINLYTYISIAKRVNKKYRISYSKIEEVENPNDIKNDIAREIIKRFNLGPITMTFNSDIPSTGSGLASSSSYTVAAVAAALEYKCLNESQFEICKIANEIELLFNPLTGYQDTYGCGLPSAKLMKFYDDHNIQITPIKLPKMNMLLYDTGLSRASTDILKTIDTKRSHDLLGIVDACFASLNTNTLKRFKQLLDKAWQTKKQTSNDIMSEELLKIERQLRSWYDVFMIKLCGAGGGGYFFVMTNDDPIGKAIQVKIDNGGVKVWKS